MAGKSEAYRGSSIHAVWSGAKRPSLAGNRSAPESSLLISILDIIGSRKGLYNVMRQRMIDTEETAKEDFYGRLQLILDHIKEREIAVLRETPKLDQTT